MTAATPNRPYYPALDGLRGVAILLVVTFHNFDFIKYFSFGWLGVDLFFVLSGFLITGILLNTVNSPNYFRNFYIRRVLRIFPLYYLLLIICFLVLPAFSFFRDNQGYFIRHQAWFWFYLQNWLYIFHPLDKSIFLIHLWSLAVEEQFYLLWPLVVFLVKKPKTLLIIMAFILLFLMITRCALWFFQPTSLSNFNIYIFTRIDGICVGCILALVKYLKFDFIRNYSSVIVLLLSGMNFLFYFLNRANSFSFPYFAFVGYTTFAIMFALLVYEAVSNNNKLINTLFGKGPLKFLGKISYGFYIFFWPIYFLLTPFLERQINSQVQWSNYTSHFISSTISTLTGLGLSILSFYFFESRFLKLKKYFA